MAANARGYRAMYIMSNQLEIPRNTYQRDQQPRRVQRMVKEFDERVANEPKVSFRNGRYYVFDGQHTIAARVERNGGVPLPILCKVYLGLSEQDEASLLQSRPGFPLQLLRDSVSGLKCFPVIPYIVIFFLQRRLQERKLIMISDMGKTESPVLVRHLRSTRESGMINIGRRSDY